MKKLILSLIVFSVIFLSSTRITFAAEDPLSKPNNFVGIHILFPEEIGEAAKLVNGGGGEWGYVIVPIRTVDMDLVKWQKFMDEARANKVIPIVRIATEPYYKNTATWRVPHKFDGVDFANFLNSLNWPTKNKYVVLYNEINRFDEWGGKSPDPKEYADILERATLTFKVRDPNFYIIMGGLDNGAPNDGDHMNNYTFLEQIAEYKPHLFNEIDAFASHSYPNPAFAQPPGEGKMSVATYRYEYDLINSYTDKKKPVFITETGWDSTKVSEDKIAEYYKQTLNDIWGKDKDKIVAITPFLLNSHGGFDQFSFLKNGSPTKYYASVKDFSKTKGEPELTEVKKETQTVQGVKTTEKFTFAPKKFFAYKYVPEIVKEYSKSLLGY